MSRDPDAIPEAPALDATEPALRVDARRNREALVRAARTVFAQLGADAPLGAVVDEAGVGRATLYRHFPTRAALCAAVMQDHIAALSADADALARAPRAWHAVEAWIDRFDRSTAASPGMHVYVVSSFRDAASPSTWAPVERSFSRLWRQAQAQGLARKDLDSGAVITLVGALPRSGSSGRADPAALQVVLDGLRARRAVRRRSPLEAPR